MCRHKSVAGDAGEDVIVEKKIKSRSRPIVTYAAGRFVGAEIHAADGEGGIASP
jgi:hypothetical protein